MDTYESNPVPGDEEQPLTPPEQEQAPAEEPVAEQTPPEEPVQGVYNARGVGRKESPYADSPYVMNRPQEQTAQTSLPRKPAKEPKKPVWKRITAALLVVALVVCGCLITAACVNEYWEERTEDTTEMLLNKIDSLQKQLDSASSQSGSGIPIPTDGSAMTPSQVYSSCVDSVVAISSTVEASSFYGSSTATSSGSGFILTEDGYVITNYHVVEDATAVDVTLHNTEEYPAEVVGYDSANDLAVLKIDAEGLSAATVGSSSDLVVGDMVVAIGNPLGELTATQTVGYVSGINREVTTDNTILSMIQTDAAINPGNSGGPLFNLYGQVVGITTAKYSGTTTSGASIEGIGFAIPIDDVMSSISDLIDYGYVTGAYLGVSVQNTDEESASMFGLPTGAYVVSVVEGASADRAGIQVKDIIIDLGGNTVSTVTDLTRALRNFRAGDETTITVIRSGQELTLDITLDEKPQDTDTSSSADEEMPSDGDYEEWYEYFRRYFGE